MGKGSRGPRVETTEFQPGFLGYKLSFLRHGPVLIRLKGIKVFA